MVDAIIKWWHPEFGPKPDHKEFHNGAKYYVFR